MLYIYYHLDNTIIVSVVFMSPTLKKLWGPIVFGLSFRPPFSSVPASVHSLGLKST